MSITFYITEEKQGPPRYRCAPYPQDCPEDCRACHLHINMANGNALLFMEWVGMTIDYGGVIKATDLAALCMRRLWPEERNVDPGIPSTVSGNIMHCGTPPGYLTDKAQRFLEVCTEAKEGFITWG